MYVFNYVVYYFIYRLKLGQWLSFQFQLLYLFVYFDLFIQFSDYLVSALHPFFFFWSQLTSCLIIVFDLEERWLRGKASDCQSRGVVVQSHLPPFRNLGNFVHVSLPVSFGRDTKSRWSLLSGVYAGGSKRSHTGGRCVTCSGLTNSREGQLWKPSSTIL